MHINRNVKLNAADGVDYLLGSGDIDDHIFVYAEAEHILKARLELADSVFIIIDARGINVVYLLDVVVCVYKRITGYIYDIQLAVNDVETSDHNGVGIVADLIESHDHKSVHSVVAAVGDAGLDFIAVIALKAITVHIGCLGKVLYREKYSHEQYSKNYKYGQKDLAGLLLFFLFVPFRLDLLNTAGLRSGLIFDVMIVRSRALILVFCAAAVFTAFFTSE